MHFVKIALDNGGIIKPLIIPSEVTDGTGIMNPSIFIDNGKIILNLRHVNYTFYHSEKKIFQHPWGPLTYIHPQHDMHLRTNNYYCELDDQLNITRYNKIDTSTFDTYKPRWDFVGLEDARIFRWDEKLFISGVRRDTTDNGQGRMELSEIVVEKDCVKEVSRVRIGTPDNPDSYCEKNWMPVIDMPYHFIKWANPPELVKVNPESGECEFVSVKNGVSLPRYLRGGSQVIPANDLHIAVTHEVELFKSEVGRKDGIYKHRFIAWNKDWDVYAFSRDFSFMDAHVEFCVGLAYFDNHFLFTFGFQDNAAYILKVPEQVVVDFFNNKY